MRPAAGREEVSARLAALRTYPWSSYRAYIGLEKPPTWLCVEELRALIGGPRGQERQTYRAYVEEAIREGIEASPLEEVQAQIVLGGASLVHKAQQLLGRGRRRDQPGAKELSRRDFADVKRIVSELKREKWEQFRDRHGDWGRDLALWLGRTQCGLRLSELGALVGGIDYSSVSIATIRWGARCQRAKKLMRIQKKAIQMLNAKL